MPFVPAEHRLPEHEPCCVGDDCYWEYFKLMGLWKKEPRWANAHNITKDWFGLQSDEDTAHFLAYMVWFNKIVMPYEDLKEKENGAI